MTEVMVDIETLSTAPDALIVSIGAVLFERHGDTIGESFYHRVALNPALGRIDASTLEWWMARASKWPSPEGASCLALVLGEFSTFYSDSGAECLWTYGIFDLPILATAYRACGVQVPWHYRAPRDARTLLDVTGMLGPDGLPHGRREADKAHHALEDAKAQARLVQQAARHLWL